MNDTTDNRPANGLVDPRFLSPGPTAGGIRRPESRRHSSGPSRASPRRSVAHAEPSRQPAVSGAADATARPAEQPAHDGLTAT